MTGPHLSAADLHGHDPRARPWEEGRKARFCCPLPECQGKKVDAAHRTLTVYPEGGWTCARCKGKGKLTDVWEDRPFTAHKRRTARDVARSAFSLPPAKPAPQPTPEPSAAERHYDPEAEAAAVVALPGTPSAEYLASRGIPLEVAQAAKVHHSDRFGHSCWWEREGVRHVNGKGAPAAVFPMRLGTGRVVGLCGRAAGAPFWRGVSKLTLRIDSAAEAGAFYTPGALDASPVVLVEAPIDALSLAACGVPAVATVGTSCPEWLLSRLALRRVVLAHDADEAGDKAADAIAAELVRRGAHCVRLRPSDAKDWNEALTGKSREALAADLRTALGLGVAPAGESFEPLSSVCREDALESASNPLEHAEYVEGTQNAREAITEAKTPDPEPWPLVGSRSYAGLGDLDKCEACAVAGMPSSAALADLLGKIKRNEASGSEQFRAGQLRAAVEFEATRISGR